MRSHAKASTAGSTQRQATGLGRFFRGADAGRGTSSRAKGSGASTARLLVLATAVLALVLAVGPADASQTHNFKERFGSAAQPDFTNVSAIAVDQSSGDVLVMDGGLRVIKRFNPDGTPSNFSALGANVIDGKEGPDTTPQGELFFGSPQELQIAVDNSGTATDGNIYLTQASQHVVDVFASTGAYLGQLTGFTTGGGGSFSEPCGVTVDPLGNVYVGDFSSEDLVHKYDPAASVPVNGDNVASFNSLAGESSPCTLAAGEGPTAGFLFVNRYNGELFKVDSTTGELKYQLPGDSYRTVSVDPGTGHVLAPRLEVSNAELAEYDATGAAGATQVASILSGFTVFGAAADGSSGEIYLAAQLGVMTYEGQIITAPEVVTQAATNNTGARATLNGAVDPDGVELDECFFEWGTSNVTYGNIAPCAETPAAIGAGTSLVAVHADISGLKPQSTGYHFRLVAENPDATIRGGDESFSTPNTVSNEAATAITTTVATLNGTVNPDGEALTECVFEWGPEKEPGTQIQTFPETAPCVPAASAITGTSPVAVHADISGLDVASTYHYRLKVVYPGGTVVVPVSSDTVGGESFQTAGPAIEGAWSEDVVHTEATLKAAINPNGLATTYRFEWGETPAYGNESESNVGSDSSSHEVTEFLTDLEPGTTYHYRVTAISGVAENVGPDQTFTTYEPFVSETDCPNQVFRVGYSAALPECRAYEMVNPVEKNGGDVRGPYDTNARLQRYIQASLDGNKLAYSSQIPFGDAPTGQFTSQYIASRGAAGWFTHGISPPRERTTEGTQTQGLITQLNPIKAFSPDLSTAWAFSYNVTPLAPGAVEGGKGTTNLYRRDNTDDTYTALGLKIGSILGFTPDLSHVLISVGTQVGEPTGVYADGELHMIGILPDGTPVPDNYAAAGSGLNLDHAISDDGRRVFWSWGNSTSGTIYVRQNPTEEQSAVGGGECTESAKACTIQISEGDSSLFWSASPDGSKVLYTEGSLTTQSSLLDAELKLTDVDAGTTRTIAGKVRGVAGASDDLSRVYFVSEDALALGAIAGNRNLYLDEEGAVSFVAALSIEDSGPGTNPHGDFSIVASTPIGLSTRVTSDGSRLVFMSDRSLTGYDNTDADTGEAADEVYLYDADGDELTCISCNPSGARPQGDELRQYYNAFFSEEPLGRAAAWLNTYEHNLHGGRALSDDGSRLFFNAYDALVPQDTNGAADVYEWRAQGTSGCAEPEGCVDLITSGQSPDRSEFLDASPDGHDVFVETNAGLLPQDPGLIDIYDARIGGGYPPPPAAPIPCTGDACQSPPSAPNDPTPASAGFRGKGNLVPQKSRRRGCKARKRHAAKHAKHKRAKHKKAKSCKRANRRAAR